MNIPVEIIEQIEEEDLGRSLEWLCNFVASLGHDRPFTLQVLRGMWFDGYIEVVNHAGEEIPQQTCKQIFYSHVHFTDERVIATDRGLTWAYYG